ncbi:carboxypeptidase-like regulatory domain-containing protein [Nocardioides stalactiti]|uniref:carboxypeptidase-like regulatory domain-containing protein n=1 Tax=Nocardioides stalactiti TaxID=2755356 RepID=UPI0015FFC1D2|nr:carboxypeptidase-like regulatory domain-containing protein [Nocardioides stalactiti]
MPTLRATPRPTRVRTLGRLTLATAAVVTAGLAPTLPALAGSATAAAPTTMAGPGWVTGVVVDDAGNPVPGALVNVLAPREVPGLEILGDTDRRAVTDSEGRFRVRQDPRGFLVQVCEKQVEAPTSCTTPDRSDHLMRYAGPDGQHDSWVLHTDLYDATKSDLDVGTVELQDPARITGTLEGAEYEGVQLLRLDGSVAWRGQTDEHGAFAFEGLVPGTYSVRAGGFGSLVWESDEVTIDADHPGLLHGSLEPGVTLTGKAYDEATGEPARRTEIFLADGDGDWIASLFTTRRGTYTFTGLLPGDYQVGKLIHSGAFVPSHELVTVDEDDVKVRQDVPLSRGATATIRLRGTDGRVDSELRDVDGNVIYPNLVREDGSATYPGLARGTYTLVAKDRQGYGLRTFRVREIKDYDLGRLRLDEELLTLRGRTAPFAVVEATTSDLCPADDPERHAGFHEIEQADAEGRYVIRGLVPGDRWMVAADGYPRNYAPICHEDVKIWSSRRFDVPLEVGHRVTGRLVYAGTDLPVITTLAYQVTYPQGQVTNPTREHPTRIRTRGATGEFTLTRLSSGAATGSLVTYDLDEVTDPRLSVVFPAQPGTPYWLEAEPIELDIQDDLDLGDIELVLQGA